MKNEIGFSKITYAKTYRTPDMKGCVLLVLKLRQELDGALLPVNSKLLSLRKKSIANFGGATYTSSSLN